MITFALSAIALILGYFIYGKFVEKLFGPDDRLTPAVRINDGIDYIALPSWKIFLIQFLNIAGTGPIFGSIMGMWYGPAAYLWIVLGCIFGGATHDYLAGVISLRNDGMGLPEIVGKYLGSTIRKIMLVFSLLLLIMVGAVFVLSPATLLSGMFSEGLFSGLLVWMLIIFGYYIIATMMPVNKIIGKIYPLFAFSIIFMGIALFVMLIIKHPQVPELWDGLYNMGEAKLGIKSPDSMIPAMFITIACGAISGFHATQSPMMARCLKSERQARPVFYGAMITEGLITLVWATVSSWFFFSEGWREVCSPDVVAAYTSQSELTVTQFFSAPKVVMHVCNGWLGAVGGMLAIMGVIFAPITTGDTALRSARLIVAENFHYDQKPVMKRLIISVPIFVATLLMLIWQIDNPDSFSVLWKYFGWANQTLSVFTLWAITVYLARKKVFYWATLVPAMIMTGICTLFVTISKQTMGLPPVICYILTALAMIATVAAFFKWHSKFLKENTTK